MVVMSTKSDVIPPLEEWDMNLEVRSQVCQLPRDRKPLKKANLRRDLPLLSSMGVF